jgi:hypothetical protein
MKLRYVASILSGLAALGISCASPQQSSNAAVQDVETKFEGNAQLSREEINQVIQLARKSGMKNVASIHTYNIHLSPWYGIGVNGKEEVSGRKIRTENLQVTHSSWMGTNWNPDPQEINVGKFWAKPELHFTFEYTTFQITNLSLRIRLINKLQFETADALMAAIATGKIRFANDKIRQAWESVYLTKLIEIAQFGNEYSFCFVRDRFRYVCFTCEFNKGEVFVKRADEMIS